MNADNQSVTKRRVVLEVRGLVQGVGFRPFIFGLASRLGLSGNVRNEADVVRIELQGPSTGVDAFLSSLKSEAPPHSRIDSVEVFEAECCENPENLFEIQASIDNAQPRPTIPADLATCAECLSEIHDLQERRYRYAFTNCTHCGPRWSIIRGLPYDRPRTSMHSFEMCPDCSEEYKNPLDRRFHAQPIACPKCGPQLRLLDSSGHQIADEDQAMLMAVEMVRDGKILAIKGLGGFQLVVDATNQEAVERLRARKHRPDKPLALMVGSTEAARECCIVSDEEQRLLESAATPIVLLRQCHSDGKIAEAVAPGNPYLGIMLPYTPLHHMLIEAVDRPIVCTSGNLSEEPMAITTAEALTRLGGIADGLLVHNRKIVRPVDDSVVQTDGYSMQILRRARGYAPLPVEISLPEETRMPNATVLAVGGHLKNTVALKLDNQVVIGAHVGDLDNTESVGVHHRAINDLLEFFDTVPDVVVCDLHPDYASTSHAQSLAENWGVPLIRVQHHHAHLAACAAEHGLDGPVLGLTWDGTGYGLDKTIWGGEAFLMSSGGGDSGKLEFTRVAHLRTFRLPGGDHAVRQPRRSALGALFELDPSIAEKIGSRWFEPGELKPLLAMLKSGTYCPETSSMGRLFDAVAGLCNLPSSHDKQTPKEISFEGQAAMALQFAADEKHTESYEFLLSEAQPAVADWGPVIRAVIDDLDNGLPAGIISSRFHNGLAELALKIAQQSGCSQIALSGGCFGNAFLSRLVQERLSRAGFSVYTHKKVPPGDGGICLGQVLIAAGKYKV